VAEIQMLDYLGWHEESDGKLYLGLPFSSGQIVEDAHAKLRTAFREIVAEYGTKPTLMPSHDIILSEIDPAEREAVEVKLNAYGVRFGSEMTPTERWALVCPAVPTSGKGARAAPLRSSPTANTLAAWRWETRGRWHRLGYAPGKRAGEPVTIECNLRQRSALADKALLRRIGASKGRELTSALAQLKQRRDGRPQLEDKERLMALALAALARMLAANGASVRAAVMVVVNSAIDDPKARQLWDGRVRNNF
jgi:hypothetical protein